jgi:hypothetical protein
LHDFGRLEGKDGGERAPLFRDKEEIILSLKT